MDTNNLVAMTSTTFVISSNVIIFTTQLAVDATILGTSSSTSQTTRSLLSGESLPVTLANPLTLMRTSLVSFERQSVIVTASQMANPTRTTTFDGSSIVPKITATNGQSQSSSTSSLEDEENLSFSNFPMPSSAPTLVEQIVEVTTEDSSSSVSAEALDRQ